MILSTLSSTSKMQCEKAVRRIASFDTCFGVWPIRVELAFFCSLELEVEARSVFCKE